MVRVKDSDLPKYLIKGKKRYVSGVTFDNSNLDDLLYTTTHTINDEKICMMEGGKLVIFINNKFVTIFKNRKWAKIINRDKK